MTPEKPLTVNLTQALELPVDAAAWLLDVWHMIQMFDDVADGDAVARPDLNQAVWKCFVGMPSNPFYAAHADQLHPALGTAILKWQAADEAERDGRADERSFVWRAAYYDLVLLVVLLVHGYPRAIEMAGDVMALYGESFADYRKEFPHA